MRYLAIDYGDKRTGLAVCDAAEILASPLEVLGTNSQLTDAIVRVVAEYDAECIVLGLPLNMDGSEGDRAGAVRAFAKKLGKVTELAIIFHDERLSSFDAQQKMAEMDLSRKGRKKREDALAAAAILESFLEHKHQGDGTTE